MNGRFAPKYFDFLGIGGKSLLSRLSYTLGYAFSSNEGTNGNARPEFIANTTNNRDYNADYGPTGLDQRHNLTISASAGLIGGFQLDQIYRFGTSAPISLFIPNNRGGSGIFTSDINGDGGVGTLPRGDLLPGTNIGSLGRSVGSLAALNAVLLTYNSTSAGRITPHGQRLVAAGIFSQAQLIAIGAATPVIPLLPANTPNPFENLFNADYRLSRPIRIWKESWSLEPSFSVFNVFNNASRGLYGGLAIPNVDPVTGRTGTTVTNAGSLNYAYDTRDKIATLDESRGLRQNNRRQLQFGIRFSF